MVVVQAFGVRSCKDQAGDAATVAFDGSGDQLDSLDAALRLLQAAVAASNPPHILLVTGRSHKSSNLESIHAATHAWTEVVRNHLRSQMPVIMIPIMQAVPSTT